MTDEQRDLLKASVDKVVEVETVDGDRHLVQVLFVFDEGETPDVFYLKGSVGPDGSFAPDSGAGSSVLLLDIAGVYFYPRPR
jgi:hypothetical protein